MLTEDELFDKIQDFIEEKILAPNDVYFLSVVEQEIDLTFFKRVANLLSGAAGGKIYLIQLNRSAVIERFTEQDMNKVGWYRKEQLQGKSAHDS